MTSIFGAGFAAAYASTKGGIVQLTKSLALAWAADNIQVNAILPGWFDTELTEKAREQIPGLHERVLARIAVGRWAKPADMAGTAIWLASRGSDYITGVAVPVDGGYTSSLKIWPKDARTGPRTRYRAFISESLNTKYTKRYKRGLSSLDRPRLTSAGSALLSCRSCISCSMIFRSYFVVAPPLAGLVASSAELGSGSGPRTTRP